MAGHGLSERGQVVRDKSRSQEPCKLCAGHGAALPWVCTGPRWVDLCLPDLLRQLCSHERESLDSLNGLDER